MKKSLLIAASLATLAGGAVIDPVKATTPPASTDDFTINAASPGTMTFSGAGTAQFNNSTGTSNSFQVGSSTNLGVNASSSSTAEYNVVGQAKLELAGTTTLDQVIGTSGSSASNSNTRKRAHDNAYSAMSSWGGGSKWVNSATNGYANETAWKAAYDAEYKREYSNSYTTMSGAESSKEDSGTISGIFNTQETGAAKQNSTFSDWESAASASADAKWGVDHTNQKGTTTYAAEADWQAAYDREYNRSYGAAAAGASRSSSSEVTVNGIGSDASVNAKDSSTFSVDISQNSGVSAGSTATAQGSAGASLATSSFANQSQSSTASGFMQAFGG